MNCPRCGYGPLDKSDPPRKKCPACFLRLDGATRRRREHVSDQPRLFVVEDTGTGVVVEAGESIVPPLRPGGVVPRA